MLLQQPAFLSREASDAVSHPEALLEEFPQTERSRDWMKINYLDSFLRDLYWYHVSGGYWASIAEMVANVLTVAFTIVFSSFLVIVVDWRGIMRCSNGSHTPSAADSSANAACNGRSALRSEWPLNSWFATTVLVYVLVFSLYLLWHIGSLVYSLSSLAQTRAFYTYKLGICDDELTTIDWALIVDRIVALQLTDQMALCHNRKLDALDITNRIMRKENYFLALLQQRVLKVHVPLSKRLRNRVNCLFAYFCETADSEIIIDRRKGSRKSLSTETASMSASPRSAPNSIGEFQSGSSLDSDNGIGIVVDSRRQSAKKKKSLSTKLRAKGRHLSEKFLRKGQRRRDKKLYSRVGTSTLHSGAIALGVDDNGSGDDDDYTHGRDYLKQDAENSGDELLHLSESSLDSSEPMAPTFPLSREFVEENDEEEDDNEDNEGNGRAVADGIEDDGIVMKRMRRNTSGLLWHDSVERELYDEGYDEENDEENANRYEEFESDVHHSREHTSVTDGIGLKHRQYSGGSEVSLSAVASASSARPSALCLNGEHSKRIRSLLVTFDDYGYLGQILEWNIRFAIDTWIFKDEQSINEKRILKVRDKVLVNDEFVGGFELQESSARLRKFFVTLGVLNLCLLPFTLVFRVIFFFLKNAEQLRHSSTGGGGANVPSTHLSFRDWTPMARVLMREWNELPHVMRRRLQLSHKPSHVYLSYFNSNIVSVFAELLSYVSGSFVAVLIVLTLIDSSILINVTLFGRALVWYLAVFSAILASSRAVYNDSVPPPPSAQPMVGCGNDAAIIAHGSALHGQIAQGNSSSTQSAQAPLYSVMTGAELAMRNVALGTHYLPDHWRGRCHLASVKDEFLEMYQTKLMLFAQEILNVFCTPFVLMFTCAQCSEDVIRFVRDYTDSIEGVGDVCALARFDLVRMYEAKSTEVPIIGSETMEESKAPLRLSQKESEYRRSDGKLESGLISFAMHNPNWRATVEQSALIESVAALQPPMTSMQTMRSSAVEMGASELGLSLSAILSKQRQAKHQPMAASTRKGGGSSLYYDGPSLSPLTETQESVTEMPDLPRIHLGSGLYANYAAMRDSMLFASRPSDAQSPWSVSPPGEGPPNGFALGTPLGIERAVSQPTDGLLIVQSSERATVPKAQRGTVTDRTGAMSPLSPGSLSPETF